MRKTSTMLGGLEISSSIMNASGARSAERGEIYELSAVHSGALVFKSCNLAGLEQPENLKNRGVEHFIAIAGELRQREKFCIGSVVADNENEFVEVARQLDRAGLKIIELNLADDYVTRSIAPFGSFERLKALLGRVRGEIGAVMAVKFPPTIERERARAYADLLKSLRIAIAVCHNDLPKDLKVDITHGTTAGPRRPLSQAHAFAMEAEQLLDVVAVGGINSGHDAYVAHLAGAQAMQVGSALMKEGAGALARIDRELAQLLSDNGRGAVSEIIGSLRFD